MSTAHNDQARTEQKSTNVRNESAGKSGPRVPSWVRWSLQIARWLGPTVAARLMFSLFCLPRRFRRPAREQEVLRRGVPFHVRTSDGLSSWAWSWGEGPTVLLVHGWEGRGSQLSAFVDPLVARGYRVVAFDAPAHGDSSGRLATVFDFAEVMLAVASRVGRVHGVVAHSMGAVATSIALRRGLRIERAVLVAPALSPARWLSWLSAQLDAGEEVLSLIHDRMSRALLMPWRQFADGGSYDHYDMPTLVAYDEDDDVTTVDDMSSVLSRTGARSVRTRGLGHRRVLRDERVVHESVDFLLEGQPPHKQARGFQQFLGDIDHDFEFSWA
jgi:pimeloyl-ACP methyl ester carboxylesterase